MTVLGSLDGIYFISYIHKGSMLETFAIIVNGNLRSIVSHLLSRIQAQVNMNKNKISKSVNSLRKKKTGRQNDLCKKLCMYSTN